MTTQQDTTQTTPAPLPWRVRFGRRRKGAARTVMLVDANYEPVAETYANVELIARAVNAHDDLLAALEDILDLPAADDGSRIIPAGFLDAARAAIAKAEGQ